MSNSSNVPPPRRGSLLGVAFVLSVLLNFFFAAGVLGVLVLAYSLGGDGERPLKEKFHSGRSASENKVAVVEIEGVILEGFLGFAHRQIAAAAEDDDVKAVVLRVNSPGGSVTASDDLHRRVTQLRDGRPEKKTPAKPVVVSMASLAASGGYYVSVPARSLFAEPTTVTGSVGVYAAFPNVKELGDKVGFKLQVIKAGAVKDSGSMFHDMKTEERELWQNLIDHSYLQFLRVVEEGRPALKGKMQEDLVIDEVLPVRNASGPARAYKLVRYRADGGVFTAEQAKAFGLVDKIGYLEDAIAEARALAGLGQDYRAITYEKPLRLSELLVGARAPAARLDASRLSAAATPRLWYLSPQCEVAGLLAEASR